MSDGAATAWTALALGEAPVPYDAVADAYDRGIADGLAEGARAVADRVATLDALIVAARTLPPADPAPVADAIVAAVLRLVDAIVGDAPVDAALLRARAEALAALAVDRGDAMLYAHPDDAALLDDVGLSVCADAAMPCGTLALREHDREVEDGVAPARARLAELIAALGL
jgi:hypothetical protein